MIGRRRIEALERVAPQRRCRVFHEPLDLEPEALAKWRAQMHAEGERDGITHPIVVSREHTPPRWSRDIA
jgi:hypothetical protein